MNRMGNALAVRENRGVRWFSFENISETGGAIAAVSSRDGGVSEGSFATLNLSYAVGDDPERVGENRRRFASAVGFDAERVVCAEQVHGCQIASVGAESAGAGFARRETAVPEVDGLITNAPGLTLWLGFADCVPVLAHDPVRQVIGIAHAGWRGTLAGIAPRLVTSMVEHFGCQHADLRIAIGPSIGPCCYAIGADVERAFGHAWPDAEHLFSDQNGSRHLDLWEANRWLLGRVGVPVEQIVVSGRCTACANRDYFSHRGQRGQAGRIAAVIALCGGG